jgi:hypothetical protein
MKTARNIFLTLIASTLLVYCTSSNESNTQDAEETNNELLTEENTELQQTETSASKYNISWKQADISKIKGKSYRSLTEFDEYEKYTDMGGGLVGDYKNAKNSVSVYKKGNKTLVVLERLVPDNPAKPDFTAVDAIEITGLTDDINFAFTTCSLKGKFDNTIMVVYKYSDVEVHTNIILAWKADLNSEKIIEINTEDVECMNEGWGV